MNRSEIIKLIRVLSANYRNWPAEGKEKDTVMLWESMLSDMSYEIGQAAVKVHMSRSVYPPTIADIRDAATMLTSPRRIDAIEAWGMIGKAIRKYGVYRQEEAVASLPDEVALMVERFTWRELCLNENVDTLRAQFRMAWETMEKRRTEERKLLPELLHMIESSRTVKRLGS